MQCYTLPTYHVYKPPNKVMTASSRIFLLFFGISPSDTLLHLFVRQDLNSIFREDVAKTGPDGCACNKVSNKISTALDKIKNNKTLLEKEQNKTKQKQKEKHTTAGIRWWSPTQLLTSRRVA